jgi:hypothetical protein
LPPAADDRNRAKVIGLSIHWRLTLPSASRSTLWNLLIRCARSSSILLEASSSWDRAKMV